MEVGQRPGGRDLEDSPIVAIRSTELGGAVELAVAAFHQAGLRVTAISSVESVQRREHTFGSYIENRAIADNRSPIVIRSTFARRAIKTAIAALHQAGRRATAVPAAEGKQGGE